MKHIKIVPMAAEHLNDVAALELACFSRPWSRQMLAEELDNQCAAFLVALEPETEKVIGYAGLLVAADEGYITNVAVDPSRRRQGVAAQLLQVFDNFARGNQLAFLTLEVRPSNAAAIALYQGFGFEEVVWLLLFGYLPTAEQLSGFTRLLEQHRELPEGFIEDMIIKAPSPNIMNKLARSVLALYSYDELAEDMSLENIVRQSIELIARVSTIMVNAYQVKKRYYDHQSLFFHTPIDGMSFSENILSTMRLDRRFTREEAKLLDICLILHAEHGGGNNSTFACRVLSSSGTDTYAAISAAIGGLKGPRHGGANIKVMQMLEGMKAAVKDSGDDEEIAAYLRKLLAGEAGDRSGLIYGMGHAVYTKSDPRAGILKTHAEKMAVSSGFAEEFRLLSAVERLAPAMLGGKKGGADAVCANVDLYSGLVYKMLGIPDELFTPLFAVARMAGWCAHRIEEVMTCRRIVRPAYKTIQETAPYVPLYARKRTDA